MESVDYGRRATGSDVFAEVGSDVYEAYAAPPRPPLGPGPTPIAPPYGVPTGAYPGTPSPFAPPPPVSHLFPPPAAGRFALPVQRVEPSRTAEPYQLAIPQGGSYLPASWGGLGVAGNPTPTVGRSQSLYMEARPVGSRMKANLAMLFPRAYGRMQHEFGSRLSPQLESARSQRLYS